MCLHTSPPRRSTGGRYPCHVERRHGLVAQSKEHLQVMAMELAALENKLLAMKWEKVPFWTKYRRD